MKTDNTTAQRRLENTLQHLQPSDAFRYTVKEAEGVLSKEERQFYEENGYIVVKSLVKKEELEKYRQRFVDIAEGRVERIPTMLVMKDIGATKRKDLKGEYAVAKIQDYQDDPILFQYCSHPDIIRYVRCFAGADIKSMHTMLINKPPNMGVSSTHPLHQDLHYFPFRPIDRIVCSWTAIERVTKENGCLVVIPGTHKGELLRHGYPDWEGSVNSMYHSVEESISKDNIVRVYAEMEPGDTIFFHPLLIHGSGPNLTQGFRKAISCHYASSHCYYIDVKGTLQENIAKEVEEIAMRKFGNGQHIPFDFVWRLRSRLVAGEEGTL